MIELRLHRSLYAGEAVDQAVKAFTDYAKFELSEASEHWIVRLDAGAADPARERRVAGELANHALGLTVERRGRRP